MGAIYKNFTEIPVGKKMERKVQNSREHWNV